MKYNPISLDEMNEVLTGWTEVNGSSSTKEYVYEKAIPENTGIVVRIFTSIHKDTSIARRCGGDAIRICAVNIPARKGVIPEISALTAMDFSRKKTSSKLTRILTTKTFTGWHFQCPKCKTDLLVIND